MNADREVKLIRSAGKLLHTLTTLSEKNLDLTEMLIQFIAMTRSGTQAQPKELTPVDIHMTKYNFVAYNDIETFLRYCKLSRCNNFKRSL